MSEDPRAWILIPAFEAQPGDWIWYVDTKWEIASTGRDEDGDVRLGIARNGHTPPTAHAVFGPDDEVMVDAARHYTVLHQILTAAEGVHF